MSTPGNKNSGNISPKALAGCFGILVGAFLLIVVPLSAYQSFRIDVQPGEVAVLIRKIGIDLDNSDEIAPTPEYKGVQLEVLREGRYFYNPYEWEWEIVPQVDVPTGKIGVRTRLYGEDLPAGEYLAKEPTQKGIIAKPLEPGRYPVNPYAERIDLYDPVTIPAGFKGVATNLAGAKPKDPNQTLVDAGERGVQAKTLDPGIYFLNPFVTRVNLVDCRNQRIDLADNGDLGFPTKDGFWVSLDGIVEFRVKPDRAPEVYVLYNEFVPEGQLDTIDEEIRNKVILPNARSFCRLQGSNNLGRELIQGDTRSVFAEKFRAEMRKACDPLGVEIVDAQITRIRPPEKIAQPLRDREIAKQKQEQYSQQTKQQISEQELAIQNELVKQKQSLVQAEQQVIKVTTDAMQKQQVAVTQGEQQLAVAKLKLEAAKDEAAAILSRGQGAAQVVVFQNEAEAAGWKQAVSAFDGDGTKYARYVLYQKIAPSYKTIMANTADSPIMDIFKSFTAPTGSTATTSTKK
ncbi:MAG: hypothetical protein JNM18_10605 [Planctomycetaceae bacterium]|nr:hypothetical protein [Planctomycetaceae bacterium]